MTPTFLMQSTLDGWLATARELAVFYGARVTGALLVLAAGWWLAGRVRRSTARALERSRVDEALVPFLSSLAYAGTMILVAVTVLGLFGIPTASVVAVLGAAGLAVGLAFQGTLSNFAAGIMLLAFRPFGVGDKVSVAGVTGSVDEIGLFTTAIDSPDNRRFVVPNSEIFGSTMENLSHHEKRRVDVAVGTGYGADLGETRSVLEDVARGVEGTVDEPPPKVYLDELGGSSINWSVRVWAPTGDYWDVRERLTRAIKEALDDAAIDIPYPNMDVHVDGRLESAES